MASTTEAENRLAYPTDSSPVCGEQMTLYDEVRPDFQKYSTEVIGISVDGTGVMRAPRLAQPDLNSKFLSVLPAQTLS